MKLISPRDFVDLVLVRKYEDGTVSSSGERRGGAASGCWALSPLRPWLPHRCYWKSAGTAHTVTPLCGPPLVWFEGFCATECLHARNFIFKLQLWPAPLLILAEACSLCPVHLGYFWASESVSVLPSLSHGSAFLAERLLLEAQPLGSSEPSTLGDSGFWRATCPCIPKLCILKCSFP